MGAFSRGGLGLADDSSKPAPAFAASNGGVGSERSGISLVYYWSAEKVSENATRVWLVVNVTDLALPGTV